MLAGGAAGSGEDGTDDSGSEDRDVLTSGPNGSGTEDSGPGCKGTESSGETGSEFDLFSISMGSGRGLLNFASLFFFGHNTEFL